MLLPIDFVNDVEGPQTCNSYNMLKLTEDLFLRESAKQNMPITTNAMMCANHTFFRPSIRNMVVMYFYPPRLAALLFCPASTKRSHVVLCVGSGMENHGKYRKFSLFTLHQNDSFLNLFVPKETQNLN
ncbi:MAG: glycoside hydrolase family 127 protein [Draconibacterium sp.]|nr:glycoside hydrolase family 127 protein [Draconibacterium sp.]